jgi:hypothetical protein
MSTSVDSSPARSKFRCDGTLDIECADWDRFRLGCIYQEGAGARSSACHYDPDALIDDLRDRGGHFWAHAGGIYDLLLIAERLRSRGIKFAADLAAHRITRLTIGNLTLRDSYSLIPFPMDELVSIIGEKPNELPWSCECGRDCGGYCKIPTRCDLPFDPDLEDYCMADCRQLYRIIHRVKDHAAEHDIDLRGTLGSTAWATAKRVLELPDADLPWHLWRRVRKADKGGRLAITKPRAHGPGVHFDIRNAYPGALSKLSIPIGATRELGGTRARLALERDRPGIYNATVTVPEDSFLPPLPWRCGGRVSYPTGTFSGSWPANELLAAIERGTKVVDVHGAIIWEAEAAIFGDLMQAWYAIRRKVGKDTPLGSWQSRLAKALTGKFAELPNRERIIVHPDKLKICLRDGRCKNGCTGRCGRYEQLDLFGYVWSAPYWKLAPSGHAHWSAYLRAHTRIQWLTAAERYKPGEICYGDTDSIWVTGRVKPEPISEDLGAWEQKHVWTGLEVRAPKVYAFVDGMGRNIYRGAPGITDEDWRKGHTVIDRGVKTLRQAVRGIDGLFKRKERRFTIPAHDTDPEVYGDRRLDPVTGITYPQSAKDHRDHLQASREAKASAQEHRQAVRQGARRIQ